MSATTSPRYQGGPPAKDAPTQRPAPERSLGSQLSRDDVRRTLLVGTGSVLCFAPMRTIFTDWIWLVQTVAAVICVLGPAAYLRSRRGPRVGQLLPGLVLLVFFVCAVYLHASSFAGFIPDSHTWTALKEMRAEAALKIRTSGSPLDSTPVLRLGVVPGLALVAAIVDAYAVVRRAPALAGIPLLALFTICGATAGRSVGWIEFAVAAAGFLIILSADSRVSLLGWGRVVPRRSGDVVARPRLGLSGRRVGVAAVVLAVLVPTILPGLSGNRLAEAFHPGTGGGGGGLSPFASLRGQLTQGKSVPLATVSVEGAGDVLPFYARTKVLSQYTASGWRSDAGPATTPVDQADFDPPAGEQPSTARFNASFHITGMKDDALPLFSRPTSLNDVPSGFDWDGDDTTVGGSTTRRGDVYEESVAQPNPSIDDLRAATTPAARTGQVDPNLLDVPTDMPSLVRTTLATVTAGQTTPYDRARALNDFFRDGENGFTYSLSTKDGDSGSDLVDFLTNRVGFCQQYAAAMGIMLRMAGIPARVVLGYTHSAPDKNGNFTITSHDAHAWAEGYFTGLGWISFDPTPLSPSRATSLPYDPRPSAATATSTGPGLTRSRSAIPTSSAPSASGSTDAAGTGQGGAALDVPGWAFTSAGVAVALAVLLSIVPGWRQSRRRSRQREALRTGRLEPLWRELHDLGVDTGVDWGATTTPRQVPGWLAGLGVTGARSIDAMADRVERERYARPDPGSPDGASSDDVHDAIDRISAVGRSLRARLSPRQRVQAWLWPRSLTSRRRSAPKA